MADKPRNRCGWIRSGWAGGIVVTLGLALALSALPLRPLAAQLSEIAIGTGPTGSAYHRLGLGIAGVLGDRLELPTRLEPFAATNFHLPLIEQGALTLGIGSNLDAGIAYRGEGEFRGAPARKLRLLARVWSLPLAFIAPERPNLRTLADLKGQKVIAGFRTSRSLSRAVRALLTAAGLGPGDFRALEVGGLGAGLNRIMQSSADAAPVVMAMPQLLRAHNSATNGLRLLALGPEITDQVLHTALPGLYTVVARPDRRRPYIRGATQVAVFDAYLLASSGLPEMDGYRVLRELHQGWRRIRDEVPFLEDIETGNLAPRRNTLPYHPGAERYFKEMGLWTGDHAAPVPPAPAVPAND